jgi:hypothetical protein
MQQETCAYAGILHEQGIDERDEMLYVCERCRQVPGTSFCDRFWLCQRCAGAHLKEIALERVQRPLYGKRNRNPVIDYRNHR